MSSCGFRIMVRLFVIIPTFRNGYTFRCQSFKEPWQSQNLNFTYTIIIIFRRKSLLTRPLKMPSNYSIYYSFMIMIRILARFWVRFLPLIYWNHVFKLRIEILKGWMSHLDEIDLHVDDKNFEDLWMGQRGELNRVCMKANVRRTKRSIRVKWLNINCYSRRGPIFQWYRKSPKQTLASQRGDSMDGNHFGTMVFYERVRIWYADPH